MVHRPEGQSASSRRPSSNAAAQLGRPGRSDPGDRRQLRVGGAGEAGQAVMLGERLFGQVDRIHAPRAGAPYEGDQLGRAQPAGAAQGEPLAGTLGLGHLAQGPAGSHGRGRVEDERRKRIGHW